MNTVLSLTRRNLRVFLRDRSAVFFSVLSPLIMVILYVLFLGHLQVAALTAAYPKADPRDVSWFIESWVLSGAVMMTTVAAPLGALGGFVDDRASGRFSDFVVSPVRRLDLALGYLLTSMCVALCVAVPAAIVGEIVLVLQGHPPIGPAQALQLVGAIVVSSAAFAALISFAVTFITSTAAFSALASVLGTMIGFIAGAYLPMGMLPSRLTSVLCALPFAQSASLFRLSLTHGPISAMLGQSDTAGTTHLRSYYGIDLFVGGSLWPATLSVVVLVVIAVVFTVLSAWRLTRTIR